jgi:hypothetical protein
LNLDSNKALTSKALKFEFAIKYKEPESQAVPHTDVHLPNIHSTVENKKSRYNVYCVEGYILLDY